MITENQIEEMAKIIGDNTEQDTMWTEIYDCANALYNAGYRMASEVAEEVFEWLEEKGLLNIEVWAIQDVKAELKKKYESEKGNG